MEFVLGIGKDIAIGIVANYLFTKLSGHKGRVRLRVNKRITEMDEGSTTRIIEEAINYDERG